MPWREYLQAIVIGGIECLAPSERFRRDLVAAFQEARVLEDDRIRVGFPPAPGRRHQVAPATEVRALARTSWSYMHPSVQDSLRAATMLLLGTGPGEPRDSQARALCARLVNSLVAEQPLAGWLNQPVDPEPPPQSVWPDSLMQSTNALAETLEHPDLQSDRLKRAAAEPPAPRQTIRAPLSALGPGAYPSPAPGHASPPPVAAPVSSRIRLDFIAEDGASYSVEVETGKPCRIGRDPTCDIALPDPKMSRQHFRLEFPPGGIVLAPENARNGILVDGSLVNGPCQVFDGTIVVAGSHKIAIVVLPPDGQ